MEDPLSAAEQLFAAGKYDEAAAVAADGLQRKGQLPADVAKLLSRRSEVLAHGNEASLSACCGAAPAGYSSAGLCCFRPLTPFANARLCCAPDAPLRLAWRQ